MGSKSVTLFVSSAFWIQKKKVETQLNTSSTSMRFVGVVKDPDSENGPRVPLPHPQTAYKLLELYVRLRELGHPQYVQLFGSESLACSISREEADRRVSV